MVTRTTSACIWASFGPLPERRLYAPPDVLSTAADGDRGGSGSGTAMTSRRGERVSTVVAGGPRKQARQAEEAEDESGLPLLERHQEQGCREIPDRSGEGDERVGRRLDRAFDADADAKRAEADERLRVVAEPAGSRPVRRLVNEDGGDVDDEHGPKRHVESTVARGLAVTAGQRCVASDRLQEERAPLGALSG